mgnify:CR=1 FL=1
MYAINYDGLRKRDTYNELIDYIQFGQEKITYPDRFAKRIRESPQISNLLDGEGLGKGDMEEQQLNHMKEILKEFAVREAGGTAQVSRASRDPPFIRGSPTPSDYDPQVQDLADMLQNITLENDVNQQRQANDTRQQNQNRLNNVNDQNNRFLLGGHRMLPNNPVASLPRPPPAKSSSSLQPMEYDIGTPRMAKAKSEPKPKSLNLLRSNIPKATQPPNPVENFFGHEPESEARAAAQSVLNRAVAKAVPKTPSTGSATPVPNFDPVQTIHSHSHIAAVTRQVQAMPTRQLRRELSKRGQSSDGDRDELIRRLIAAMMRFPPNPGRARTETRRGQQSPGGTGQY